MASSQNNDASIPVGSSFLELVWRQENRCEQETDERIPNLGVKAPACLDRIGTALSLLDRMASCWWVCRGGDHLLEYICGRVASNARAALRLLRFGFYDESLLVCRAMGETANLLELFVMDKEALADWKASSRRERLTNFSPVKVRLRLEDLQRSPIIDESRYALLCERAAHVHPETKPQSHNILGVPVAGASLQEAGILVCLNEIAIPLSATVTFGVILLELEKDVREQVLSNARSLAEQIGGAMITEIDEYFHNALNDPSGQDELKRIANVIRRFQAVQRKRSSD